MLTTTLLLDDFRDPSRSRFGTAWSCFTDQVMGGASSGDAAIVTVDGRSAQRLRGRVRLDNNGGFVQVALPLDLDGRGLDASGFSGVRLLVRGAAPSLALHLRTRDSTLPWQYYGAPVALRPEWTTVDVPFSSFVPASLRRPLDLRGLRRLGVVAGKPAGDVLIELSRIELA